MGPLQAGHPLAGEEKVVKQDTPAPGAPVIAHVVLFRPSANLAESEKQALLDAMRAAFTGIAEIRRIRIGKRLLIGRPYETDMAEHYEYSAIIEFDSETDLRAYLNHPAHVDLGQRFFQTADAALVYDFVMVEPDRVGDLLA